MKQRDDRTTAEAFANRNMVNRKPYRTKELKEEARRNAVKCEDGTWRSTVKVLFHGSKRSNDNAGR